MEKAHPLFNALRSAKDSLYNLLYTTTATPDSIVNTRAALIGERQMKLDRQMFTHFKTVRNICTPEQLPKFDSSFKSIVQKITGRFRRNDDKNKTPDK